MSRLLLHKMRFVCKVYENYVMLRLCLLIGNKYIKLNYFKSNWTSHNLALRYRFGIDFLHIKEIKVLPLIKIRQVWFNQELVFEVRVLNPWSFFFSLVIFLLINLLPVTNRLDINQIRERTYVQNGGEHNLSRSNGNNKPP